MGATSHGPMGFRILVRASLPSLMARSEKEMGRKRKQEKGRKREKKKGKVLVCMRVGSWLPKHRNLKAKLQLSYYWPVVGLFNFAF